MSSAAFVPFSEVRAARGDPWCFGLMIGVLALWLIVHGLFWGRLIYHDAWMYNFPKMLGISKGMACAGLPEWLGKIDSGTPVSIYTTSDTITNPLRLALLFFMSCLKPSVEAAVYLQKAHIFIFYLWLASSMYVMGRVLFRHQLSAVYLFAATLFAGLCMQTAHSDQAAAILFWLPWIVICLVKFHRQKAERQAHWYLNAAALFVALQSLDQSPHFIVFAAGLALILYAVMCPQALLAGLRLHWLRLWPAAFLLLLTAAHLHFLLGEIAGYIPSVRRGLNLVPSEIGQNALVQPTALIGAVFPLSFTVAYDSLEFGLRTWLAGIGVSGGSQFIYELDVLMFFVGIVPGLLATVFLLRPGCGRLRAGWGLFALLCLLVPMQDTRLYLLLFHLPFFNLFRSYLLLFLFGLFAVLVMSGFGMDALLTLAFAERRRLICQALLLGAVLAADAAVAFGWLLSLPDTYTALPRTAVLDILILLAGFGALAWGVLRAGDIHRGMFAVVVVLVASQALYQVEVYRIVGIPVAQVIDLFGLDAADRTPLPAATVRDPNVLTRKLCARFAECYLSTHDTASLNRDLQGTFLRSREEAVFQPGLARPVIEALSAVGHPVFWTSRGAASYVDAAELTRRLNAQSSRIAEHLSEVVYVRPDDLERLGPLPSRANDAVLSDLSRGIDWVRLSYGAASPFYLNAAIAYDPHWRATVGGRAATVVRGNFGGLVLAVPAGSGAIEFRYVNRASQLFFASRMIMGLAGLAAAAWLVFARYERRLAEGGRVENRGGGGA